MAAARRILIPVVGAIAIGLGPAAAPPLDVENAEAARPSEAARWHDDARLTHLLTLGGEAPDRARAVAEFRRALELTHGGSHAAAVPGFVRAGELLPQIRDWAYAFAADAAGKAGDTAAVRTLQAELGTSLAQEWGWLARVRALNRSGDPAGAARLARELGEVLEAPHRRANAWLTAGELDAARGATAAARAAFARAIEISPASGSGLDAARALSKMEGLTPAERLAIGRTYLRHGQVSSGLQHLDAYLGSRAGTTEQREAIRLEAGRALYNARSYEEAERRLRSLVATGPAQSVRAEATLLIGRAQLRNGRPDDARATLRRLVAGGTLPPQVASEAHFVLGDLAHDAGELEQARSHYASVVTAAPASEIAATASMRLGSLAFLARDYVRAAEIFEASAQRYSGTRQQQALYWAGRSYAALGRQSLALQRYRATRDADPSTYYGLLAADRLGERFGKIGISASPVTGADAERQVDGAILRLDVLRSLELTQAAAFEMERVRRNFAGRREALYSLAEAFAQRGEVQRAVILGRELLRVEQKWNPRLLRIVYPMPYRQQIVAAARQHGLDPFLVAGLIRQESLFNAEARSAVGALGLMQVMPSTGSVLARRTGMRRFTAEQLRNPATNLQLGTLYLRDMLREHGGLIETLAAYNAGPTRVARWRNLPERVDDELFVERIPYEETRDYVRIVQQNARIYAALYGDQRLGD